jgi:hypothetical protein
MHTQRRTRSISLPQHTTKNTQTIVEKTQSRLEIMVLVNLDGILGAQGLNEKQVQIIKASLK